jgi:hypothetical protein
LIAGSVPGSAALLASVTVSCAGGGIATGGPGGGAGAGFAAACGAADWGFAVAWGAAEGEAGWLVLRCSVARGCVACCAGPVFGDGADGWVDACDGSAKSKLKSLADSFDGWGGFSAASVCGWSEGISLGETMSTAIASVATESNGLAPVNSTASRTAVT